MGLFGHLYCVNKEYVFTFLFVWGKTRKKLSFKSIIVHNQKKEKNRFYF